MHALLIDNDDSFTWNLWQQIESLGARCTVRRNDEITIEEVKNMQPDRIVLSPGPGGPEDAKISLEILASLSGTIPILGICLGHQCIGHVFGGKDSVRRAKKVMHGKTSSIFHAGNSILRGVPSPFEAARYHSLIVHEAPKDCEVLCWASFFPTPNSSREGGIIMGLRHTSFPLFGLQFHPESFLTEHGTSIMQNFLEGRW